MYCCDVILMTMLQVGSKHKQRSTFLLRNGMGSRPSNLIIILINSPFDTPPFSVYNPLIYFSKLQNYTDTF